MKRKESASAATSKPGARLMKRGVSIRFAMAVAAVMTIAMGIAARPGVAQTPAQNTETVMRSELVAQVLGGCGSELTQFCAKVTPGEGRLLACLFSYGDKLSGQCESALYDAAARLERAINAITYVASECRAEIQNHCANVEPGEGRIAQCLLDNASQLSPGCDQALTDVGVK
jgi:Cysteine rich repeat